MKLSLIITTYNWPNSLEITLKSIENQTQTPDEVIIADDGSNAETKNTIVKYKEKSKLKIIHSWQKDLGFRAAKSRNKAIAKSSGEYIVVIDGDMILHPKFIQDHLKNAEIGFFTQGTRALLNKDRTRDILERKNTNLSFISKGIQNRKNVIRSDFLSKIFSKNVNFIDGIKTCNMAFFKRDCISINGFNNDFEGWGREDSEFAVRMLNKGIKRKNLRFNAIQIHLWHIENSRKTLAHNDLILKSSIESQSKWCINGIDRYL